MVDMATNGSSDQDRLLPSANPKDLLLSPEPWKGTVFLLVTFGLGSALSFALTIMLALSVVLSFMIVGIPLLAATAVAWTYFAQIERARIAILTGIEIPKPYRETPSGGIFARVKGFATDTAVWKDLIYLVLLFPAGILQLLIALFAVLTPIALIASPMSLLLGGSVTVQEVEIDSFDQAVVAAIIGLVMLPIAAYVITIVTRGHGLIARRLLGPGKSAS